MKIGIACDNYKLRKFRRALDNAGYTNREYRSLDDLGLPGVTMIMIITDQDRAVWFPKIRKVCQKLEIDFKHSN